MTQSPHTRQPRGIPVGGQFAPTAHAEPAFTIGSLKVRPEFDNPADQAVYDRHEQLLRDAGITHHVTGDPVLAGGATTFPLRADGREFSVTVRDNGCSVHRDAAEDLPEHVRQDGDWVMDAHGGLIPDHLEEGFTYARRRAAVVDALGASPLTAGDQAVFSGLGVHRSSSGRHAVELAITLDSGNFRLEMEDADPESSFVVVDSAAGRFLTGRMADAVLMDALEAAGLPAENPKRALYDAAAAANAARTDTGFGAGR